MQRYLVLASIISCLYACGVKTGEDAIQIKNTKLEDYLIPQPAKSNWLNEFDLDGDGKNDQIYFNYSQGAHCCYTINIALSSDTNETNFPFEMDGGYIFGVDNSLPDHFDIRDLDNDGLPEILMEIQTYNGTPSPVPKQWTSEYGIKTNYIVIEYTTGKLKARDYKP